MSTAMELLNALLRQVFDLLLWPFQAMHPLVGLTVVSTLAAVGMLIGYRATSDQEGLEETKRQIAAGLFEIRLFNDDLWAILRAQGRILRHNATYMRLNIVPMLWMIVPFVLVVAQLQFHYGYRGLEVDEPVVLSVALAEGADDADVQLSVPEQIEVDSPRVRIPAKREAAWRIVPRTTGVYEARITVDGREVTKRLVVSDDVRRRSPERFEPDVVDQLLFPAERPLPGDAPITAISIRYPDREVGVMGWDTHWLVWFLILAIGLAFALKGRFDVTI